MMVTFTLDRVLLTALTF